MDNSKFKDIPISACRMQVELVSYGTNGVDAKTVPVHILARSNKPIEHPFWGTIAHDLAGFSHKNKIAIDYCHNPELILGYANHFEVKENGLNLNGVLTPFKADDLANEVIFKQKSGVPYEASIDFSDKMQLELVEDGQSASVNGYDLAGPAVIVRQWTLRSVAICPLGADKNTETAFKDNGERISADIITVENTKDSANTVEVEETKLESVETKLVVEETKPVSVEAEVKEPSMSEVNKEKEVMAENAFKLAERLAEVECINQRLKEQLQQKDYVMALNEKLTKEIQQRDLVSAGVTPVKFQEFKKVENKTFEDVVFKRMKTLNKS